MGFSVTLSDTVQEMAERFSAHTFSVAVLALEVTPRPVFTFTVKVATPPTSRFCGKLDASSVKLAAFVPERLAARPVMATLPVLARVTVRTASSSE